MHRLTSVVGGLGVALLLCAPPASADLVKCNSGIEKNGAKLQSALIKALQKCKNAFQKVDPTDQTAVTGAAASCQGTFFKSVDASNPASTMSKTIAALDSLIVKGTCVDDDLSTLGHMTTATFGNRWEKWVALSALKAAYEEQIWLAGDMVNVLLDLGATGSCPLCTTLAVPPCAKVACSLGAGSQIQTIILGGTLTPSFSGVAIFEGCQFAGLFSGTEVATVGNPSLGIRPVDIFGNGSIIACTVGIRTEGVTACSASSTAPKIDYHSCQDHVVESGADECKAALGTAGSNQVLNCGDDSADSHHTGITNGGACALFTKTTPPPVGSSFSLNTSQLTIVMPGQFGTDGTVCTPDDTATPGMPAVIPITTGSVQSDVFDYSQGTCNPEPCAMAPAGTGTTKTIGPISGTPAPNCNQLRQGNLAGLTLVGAFPALDTRVSATALSDSVTSIKLVCQ